MDNKITKTRLSDYLAYEWIMIIIVAVIAIVVWELVYTMAGVRLSTGQSFSYYYDETVYSSNDTSFYDLLKVGKEDGTFSYDVLEVGSEALTSDYNVLSARMSTHDGDAIITDIRVPEGEGQICRAEYLIKNYAMYDLDELYIDAHAYLSRFLQEGKTDPLNYENLDESKIEAHFRERMRKDNRFRKEEDKLTGIAKEKARLQRLCKEVTDYKYFLDNADSSLFYTYKADEQSAEKRYAIKAEMLTGGELVSGNFFKNREDGTAKDVVIMIFDLETFQPDLQFETISFVNTITRNFSNILSA